MTSYRCLALIVCLLWLAPAGAEMYKWTDDEGVTHFSQTPPTGAADVLKAPLPKAPILGDEGLVEKQEQQLKALEEQQAASREAAQERDQEAAERAAINEENCAAARHNHRVLEAATRRLIRTPDGIYHRLTEAQRQQQMKQAEQMIDRACGK